MGTIRQDQFRLERQFFEELWAFRKKYYNGKGESEAFWKSCAQECNQLGNKYKGLFYSKAILACLEDIEARARKEDA